MSEQEEIEVTVAIPDESPEDENNNGIADGIEIGQATVNAENALEQAESADANASVAIAVSDTAISEAYNAQEGVSQLAEVVRQQGEVINAQSEQIGQLLEIARLNADAVMAATIQPESRTPLPEDSMPESGHWLNRKIF